VGVVKKWEYVFGKNGRNVFPAKTAFFVLSRRRITPTFTYSHELPPENESGSKTHVVPAKRNSHSL
jgi:hypothetical protein